MEPITSRRAKRSSSYERILLVGFGLLAVISPLYINQSVTDPEVDEQPSNLASWLLLLLILIIAFLVYIVRSFNRSSRFSSGERLLGIGFALLAVASPLYINRRSDSVSELEQQSSNQTSWLPLLLFFLILAIGLSLYLDQSFTRFDPNWIHRVGGSSCGIIIILVILAIILKCKSE
ncbi:uncharacterized protein [Euphorbia lathyris]|uniref:uncharacterized protein n=1 Tax=Euphorbia lathyris TaxID=212925 RepID=UPI00331394A5